MIACGIIWHHRPHVEPKQDNIVQIMEYSNTVEGFYEELRFALSLADPCCAWSSTATGNIDNIDWSTHQNTASCPQLSGVKSSWHSFPRVLMDCTMRKAAGRLCNDSSGWKVAHCFIGIYLCFKFWAAFHYALWLTGRLDAIACR